MTKHFIGGEWIASGNDVTIPMINPCDGKEYGVLADATSGEVDRAVQSARAAFEGAWGKMPAVERGRHLSRFAEAITANVDKLAAVESRDTGKPAGVAKADMLATARYFEFYGGAADKFHGETIPYLDGFFVGVVHEPYGVTAHIIPWNYPAQMFGRSVAPSLAVGNAVVVKPAEDASAVILKLAEISAEIGFPAGTINVVTGRGASAGAELASHKGIDFISFTGSPVVGQAIQKMAADHFIPCTLELGGKSPQIVFNDANLEAALPVIRKAIVQHAGQTCSAGSRLLVQKGVYDDFAKALTREFAAIRVGTPEMDFECGPVISHKQMTRVQSFIDTAKADGIPLLAEGSLAAGLSPNGFFVKPSLFGVVPRSNMLAYEEVFGPVLSILPFEDEEDAVRLANATEYGLVAGIWTADGSRQMRMARRMRCGQVFLNCYGAGAGIELPFGGVGKSGHGREKGFSALHEFSHSKTIVLNHG